MAAYLVSEKVLVLFYKKCQFFASSFTTVIFFLEWLRKHCMKVFHYCAEVLKGVSVFESCSNEDLLKMLKDDGEGAVYNDFGRTGTLLVDEDFADTFV